MATKISPFSKFISHIFTFLIQLIICKIVASTNIGDMSTIYTLMRGNGTNSTSTISERYYDNTRVLLSDLTSTGPSVSNFNDIPSFFSTSVGQVPYKVWFKPLSR
ncbi:hypothetical protein RND81_06G129100 [Saponaria officinalis]|uniref:Uncharacterized protein n=1 Tax=Saponaria officinalis TaxID=3572 RepID=A0AAW1KBB9_SAPOF